MQGNNTTYLKTSSTLKHFAVYSQETGRTGEAAVVTAQDMTDTYLPAFEAGIVHGKASGIMCSYNAETYGSGLYGNSTAPGQHGAVPSCGNKGLLTDLARGKWGFEGYVTTDCGAADMFHGYGDGTPFETVRAVLGAGVDTDCGGVTPKWRNTTLLGLMTNTSTSSIITPLIDAALVHLFTVRMRLGQFDAPALQLPWGKYGLEHVDTAPHRALALDAALQGFVLLRNDQCEGLGKGKVGVLPLKPAAKLAVLGPNTHSGYGMPWQLGNYHERATPPGVMQTPCDALIAMAPAGNTQVTCVNNDGCTVGGNASCFSSDSAKAIDAADIVLLFVGLDGSQEAEGHDRESLLLPGTQQAMVDAATTAAAASNTPVVVVVMGGSPVDLSKIKAHPGISSVVWVGYPGQAGGTAIATALYGTKNRWGKLPMTWYDEGFCTAANLSDYRMRPDPTTHYPGRTHRFYTGAPVYPFGHGLSYTKFERALSWAEPAKFGRQVATAAASGDPDRVVASVEVKVANVGDREGDEVVLLFVVPPLAAVALGAPRQQLAAFTRVTLAHGAAATVVLDITQRHLQLLAPGISRVQLQSLPWQVRVNHDSATLDLHILWK